MERWTRRVWVGIAGALVLHALLLLALALVFRAVRPRRVMQVSFLHVPRATPAKSPGPAKDLAPPAPPGQPRPVAKPGSPRTAATPERERRSGDAAAPAPTAHATQAQERARETVAPQTQDVPPAPGGQLAPGRASRERLAAEGLDRAGDGLSTALAHPEDALPAGQGPSDEQLGLVRQRTRDEKLADEKAAVGRRVEGWATDTKARDRAQTGRDRYWQSLQDALAHGFDPGWDVLDQGPKDSPAGSRLSFLDSWQKQAEAYGKSGNPFAGQENGPGARKPLHDEFIGLANEDRGLGSVSLGAGLQPTLSLGMAVVTAAAAGKSWTHTLLATVRITQREDGTLVAAELLGTSGNAAYDRLVLQKARALGTLTLGPPKQGRETLWAFETNFSQVPPVPIAGCSLDDFIPKNCWYPLQRTARSHVRLEAIY